MGLLNIAHIWPIIGMQLKNNALFFLGRGGGGGKKNSKKPTPPDKAFKKNKPLYLKLEKWKNSLNKRALPMIKGHVTLWRLSIIKAESAKPCLKMTYICGEG